MCLSVCWSEGELALWAEVAHFEQHQVHESSKCFIVVELGLESLAAVLCRVDRPDRLFELAVGQVNFELL